MNTTELLAEAATIEAQALTAAQTAATNHGITGPYGTDTLGHAQATLADAIKKIRYAKDGDGTVPADLADASVATFHADSAHRLARNIDRRIRKNLLDEPRNVIDQDADIRDLTATLRQIRTALAI